MIAVFGMAHEHATDERSPAELVVAPENVCGVHLTALKADGSGKAGLDGGDKKIIGRSALGYPIVLAAPNDLLGLAITEGIEDGLSIHQATGLGVWAAGAASRMPGLA